MVPVLDNAVTVSNDITISLIIAMTIVLSITRITNRIPKPMIVIISIITMIKIRMTIMVIN